MIQCFYNEHETQQLWSTNFIAFYISASCKTICCINCQILKTQDPHQKIHTVVGDYISIMKTTFLFKFQLWTHFFRITSLQVIKEKFFGWHILFVFMFLFIHTVLKLDISRFHNTNVIAYNCSYCHNLRRIELKTIFLLIWL